MVLRDTMICVTLWLTLWFGQGYYVIRGFEYAYSVFKAGSCQGKQRVVCFLFFLLTRYMKYLYAYECEKKSLSSPAELQAAIDGNRREGRRPSYSSSLFSYSAAATGPPSLLCPPKIRFPIVSLAPSSGTTNTHLSPAGTLRKGQPATLTAFYSAFSANKIRGIELDGNRHHPGCAMPRQKLGRRTAAT